MNQPIRTVICKKHFRSSGTVLFAEYEKGVIYEKFFLEDEIGERVDDLTKKNISFRYIYIYNKNGKGGHRFHLNCNDTKHDYMINFFDYFYDNQELRKLKLQKISNENL